MRYTDTMTGYETCKMYMALKLHFDPASQYDFFKYEGRIKWLTPEKFDLRGDRWFFHKLSKLYADNTTCLFFLASNFFHQQKVAWVRDLLGEEAKAIYLEKLRVKESLEYIVMGDLGRLLPHDHTNPQDTFKHLVKVIDGEPPALLTLAVQGDIAVETLIVLNTAMDFFSVWEKKMCDTILFPAYKHRCLAYEPFLCIDKKNFRETLKARLCTGTT